jgi:hypothetical protein
LQSFEVDDICTIDSNPISANKDECDKLSNGTIGNGLVTLYSEIIERQLIAMKTVVSIQNEFDSAKERLENYYNTYVGQSLCNLLISLYNFPSVFSSSLSCFGVV